MCPLMSCGVLCRCRMTWRPSCCPTVSTKVRDSILLYRISHVQSWQAVWPTGLIRMYILVTGAKTFQQMDEGAEIDWVALAKGRHEYKEKVKRGEVSTL